MPEPAAVLTPPGPPPAPRPSRPTGPAGPAPHRPLGGRADRAATLSLVAATLAAAAGFARVFATPGWVLPVLVTALGTHAVCWAVRRSSIHPLAGAVLDLGAVVALTVWTVLPGSTTLGLPLGRTWAAAGAALTQMATNFESSLAPVPATHGFVLLAVVGTGVTAVLADWTALRLGAGLQGIAPAFSLFVVCSVVGTERGRVWAVLLFVVAAVVFLISHRANVTDREVVWFGNRPAGAAAWRAGVGAATAAAAVAATLVVAPALSGGDGHGPLGWKGGGPGSGGNSRSVPSPIVDLRTRLLQESDTPVFTVSSAVPSYWRLTSLDTFTGIQWQSTNSYVGVSHQLPGVQPAPPGTRTVVEHFRIQQLASIWMPTAFSPESITGGGQVSWDPVSGSLLASRPTANGLDYRLTSLQYLSTLSAAELSAAPAPTRDASTAKYLQLPRSVPASVYALARRITAGARNEYQAALALQNFFVDNPAFTYSLSPPVDGYGTDSLTTFLFDTKTGYCQQFAGAYAVLARAAGIPTRLAVGFATGTALGDGTYQVRDADAHTWPEVWFGRQLGWLPFEPTKGAGFSIPGATGYTGDTSGSTPALAPSTQAPAPAATPSATPRTPAAAPLPRDRASTPVFTRPPASSPAPILIGVAAVLLAVGAYLLANAAARRLRWRRRRRRARSASAAGDGAAVVLAAWEEVCESLAWWGIRRRPDETPTELAERARRRLRLPLGTHSTLERLGPLAGAVTSVSFSPSPPDEALVAGAGSDAAAMVSLLEAAAARSLRLRRLVDPRLAWRPTLGEPSALPSPGLLAEAR